MLPGDGRYSRGKVPGEDEKRDVASARYCDCGVGFIKLQAYSSLHISCITIMLFKSKMS